MNPQTTNPQLPNPPPEIRFQEAFEHAATGMSFVSPEGRWLQVNPTLCAMLGYSQTELLGLRFQDITHPEDLPRDLEQTQRLLKGEISSFALEKRYICKNGQTLWALLNVALIRDQAGAPLYFITHVRDISAQRQAEAALQERERLFRSAFDNSPIGMALLSLEGRFLQVNLALAGILGYTPEELLALDFQTITHPDDLEKDLANVRYLLAGEADAYQMEKRYFHRTGQEVVAQLNASLVRDSQGEPEYFIAQVQDITQRHQAGEALRESEALLRQAQQIAKIGNWKWDARTKHNLMSDQLYEILGISREDSGQKVDFVQLVHPQDRARIAQAFEQAKEQNQDSSLEYRIITPKGELKHIFDQGKSLFDPSGKPLGRVGILQDITERKQAEMALKESLEKVEALYQTSRVLITSNELSQQLQALADTVASTLPADRVSLFALDMEAKRITHFAKGGPGQDQVIQIEYDELMQGLSGWAIQEFQPALSPKGLPDPRESPQAQARRSQTNCGSIAVLPLFYQGRVLGTLTVINRPDQPDFSQEDVEFLKAISRQAAVVIQNAYLFEDLRRHSQQIEQVNHELMGEIAERKRAEAELRDFAQRLERSNRELQEFAYVASHDLQEPLRKVQAFGDRLKSRYAGNLGSEGLDYLERMQNAAGRMQNLIQDLLGYSRVATQTRPFELVNLQTVATEVLDDLEARLESGGQVQIAELGTVRADPTQMRQLLQNLIGNALKFRRPGVPPLVKMYGRYLYGSLGRVRAYELVVEDNGIGFDNRHAEKIFAPFQRLHGRGEYEGTGMGLAICRRIVERHGGTIQARGVVGQGATFVVTLPQIQGGNS